MRPGRAAALEGQALAEQPRAGTRRQGPPPPRSCSLPRRRLPQGLGGAGSPRLSSPAAAPVRRPREPGRAWGTWRVSPSELGCQPRRPLLRSPCVELTGRSVLGPRGHRPRPFHLTEARRRDSTCPRPHCQPAGGRSGPRVSDTQSGFSTSGCQAPSLLWGCEGGGGSGVGRRDTPWPHRHFGPDLVGGG